MKLRIWLLTTAVMAMSMSTVGTRALGQGAPDLVAWFKAYDAAFNARNIDALATMYHKDVTIFEGTGVNTGWPDYRDNHLGPELKSFESLQFAHTNVVAHVLGDSAAYITADYTIKYKTGERLVESGGIATHVLVKEQGRWQIRHSQTAARRRPAGGE